MSGFCLNTRPGTLRLATVIAVGFSCTALARQPVLVKPETTVYLILRTGPKETEKGILATLKEGIEKSGARISGEPTIKAVSPAFLEEFESLVDRATTGPVVAAKDGASIRLLPSRDTVFEVKLATTQILKNFKVTYEKAGEKEYSPAAPGPKNPLVLTVPGRYAFTPEPNDTPTSYVCDIAELGKSDSQIKGDWPKTDKCFVVTMKNFQGDRKLLFDTIQNPKLVANPLKNVRLGNDLVFAFASLNSDAAKRQRGRIGADSQLTITIETLPERNPKRVWVYFPLNEKQMADALSKFRKFEGADLPTEIRKTEAGIDVKVGPADTPKWFELPARSTPVGVDPSEFIRKVKLDNLPGLAKAYPRAWMLVVWEFDNGGPRSAIKVEDAKGNPVFVLEQELEEWQRELQNIPAPGVEPKR
jgi:hypothetical protein